MAESKALSHDDVSGFEFAKEMLAGDETAAINFDRIQKCRSGFIVFEYLLCEEEQEKKGITPYTSHPNRYLAKNRRKFTSLWEISKALDAKLFLVNYAKAGTKHENEILLMDVMNITDDQVETNDFKYTRKAFQYWFRKTNTACLNGLDIPDPNEGFFYIRHNHYRHFFHKDRSCKFIKTKQDELIRTVDTDLGLFKPCTECVCKRGPSDSR